LKGGGFHRGRPVHLSQSTWVETEYGIHIEKREKSQCRRKKKGQDAGERLALLSRNTRGAKPENGSFETKKERNAMLPQRKKKSRRRRKMICSPQKKGKASGSIAATEKKRRCSRGKRGKPIHFAFLEGGACFSNVWSRRNADGKKKVQNPFSETKSLLNTHH